MPDAENLPWEPAFVHRMKQKRQREDLSQTELAKMAAAEGLPFYQQTIQRIENGARPIRLNEAVVLAELLGSSLDEMVQSETAQTARQEMSYAAMKIANYQTELEGDLLARKTDVEGILTFAEAALERYLRLCSETSVEVDDAEVRYAERYIGEARKFLELLNQANSRWREIGEEFEASHVEFMEESRNIRRKGNA